MERMPRSNLMPLRAGLATAWLVLACGGTTALPPPVTACAIQPGPLQGVSLVPANRFGIQEGGGAQRDARYQALLPTLRAMGIGWVRIGLNPGPSGWEGVVDWPDKDPQIRNARDAKLAIIGQLQISGGTGPVSGWESYVRQVVERYRADVHHWEIWNEPDLRAYWSGTPAQYAELLAVGYRTIKSVDPSATVLFGGLALNDAPWTKSDGGFLGQVLSDPVNPGINNFDIANLHHYGPISNARARMKFWRDQLALHGRTGVVPAWVTETGYGSNPTGGQAIPGLSGYDGQVRWMNETLPVLLDELGADKVFWYEAFDSDVGGASFATHGLFTAAVEPKPVACALRDFITAR